ncbi:MAG: PAS domain-containing protein, partial [Endozoicomonas sp.]
MHKIILDNLNTAVIVMDQNLRILTLNPAAEALLDTSVKRVQQQPVTTLIPQDDLPTDLDRA